jgi:HCOMODA/2-hydroxy-3-carboxy-muconic semialdehyde decarboxylase
MSTYSRIAAAALIFLAAPAMRLAAAQAPDPVLAAAIEDLVAASRILADQGVVDAYGHVSIRHPHHPNRYLLSRSLAPARVTAVDIMEFDLDSNPIDRQGRNLFIERFIHGEVYKARPDVRAVVHSHSPAVIPFSITPVPLRPVLHTAAFLWPGVPVWEIRDTTLVTDLLVRNAQFGKALAVTLGDKPVALMRGHGNVVVGDDVQTAVARAVYTEVNARTLTIALGLNAPIDYISNEEGAFKDKHPSSETRAWDLWKEKAMNK